MLTLSSYLYWDVRPRDVDPEQHSGWLVRRVLEHGDWPDWQKLVHCYGRKRLAEIVTGIRSLLMAIRSLAWFDDADSEPDPISHRDETWFAIKERISSAIRSLK